MGEKSEDIMTTFNLTDANSKKYDIVKAKFENHFIKRRNTIFERAKFNTRKQEAGESVDSFITDLYCLAKHCNYGTLHDEMIRDRIIVGLLDSRLSEKLQLDADLTLEKAVNSARQSELVKKQQSVVRGAEGQTSQPITVEAVNKNHQRREKTQKQGQKKQNPSTPSRSSQNQEPASCGRCGRSPAHSRFQCPAKEATCLNCKKKGHYQAVCRSERGTVNTLEDDDDGYLGAVYSTEINSVAANPWKAVIAVNGVPTEFKLDTGADVTVIPEKEFKKLNTCLKKTNKLLTGPSQHKLDVRGSFSARLESSKEKAEQQVYVVRGLRFPLLGRPAIEALNLLSVIEPVGVVQSTPEDISEKFPALFKGLGKLEGEYHIDLKVDAKPYAVTTPRRVPLPLMEKVKDELARMEPQGVTSKIDKATGWCAPMIIAPKFNGKARICVDYQIKRLCSERETCTAIS